MFSKKLQTLLLWALVCLNLLNNPLAYARKSRGLYRSHGHRQDNEHGNGHRQHRNHDSDDSVAGWWSTSRTHDPTISPTPRPTYRPTLDPIHSPTRM